VNRQHLSFLIKPTSYDCNLVCDYCFYKRTEETYPGAGAHRMDEATLTALVMKAQTEATSTASYVWQGGEPMIMGLDFYRRAVAVQNTHRRPGQTITNTLQTNGILIDREWASFLAENEILVGISIDGPQELHDAHRFNHTGESVFDRVIRACDLLGEYGVEFNVLTVVSAQTVKNPVEIYTFLHDRGYRYLQFIDCIETLDGGIAPYSVEPEAFGEFLCRLFDAWFEDGYPRVSIRLFDNYLQYRAGRTPECCMYKNDCGSYFVIEHNGDVFPCDFFVRAEWLLGNIVETSLEDLIGHPKRREFAVLKTIEHERCASCGWLGFCQRGCIKSRAFPGRPYDSLNYLCRAYTMFFEHADERYDFLAWDIVRRHRGLPPPVDVGRNDPCICGSGKKFKKCCARYSRIMMK